MLINMYRRVPDENGYVHGMDYHGQRLQRYSININGYMFDNKTNKICANQTYKPNNPYKKYTMVHVVFPDGSSKYISLQRLMADNFLPMTQDDVNHNRDMVITIGDKLDCHIDNLKRVSRSEIVSNLYKTKRLVKPKKESEYWKYIDKDLRNENMSIKEIYEKWHPICGFTYETFTKRSSHIGTNRKNTYSDDIKMYVKKIVEEYPQYTIKEIYKILQNENLADIPLGTVAYWVTGFRKELK